MSQEKQVTKIGVRERMGESKWQSPAHQVSIEVDSHRGGTRRIRVAGVKPPRYYGSPLGKPLSDKAIDKYLASGFYELRHAMLQEKNREKRLVWNSERQDFELR